MYIFCKTAISKKYTFQIGGKQYEKEDIYKDDDPVPDTGTDAHGSTGGGRVDEPCS